LFARDGLGTRGEVSITTAGFGLYKKRENAGLPGKGGRDPHKTLESSFETQDKPKLGSRLPSGTTGAKFK
jgi:hypothetical protein